MEQLKVAIGNVDGSVFDCSITQVVLRLSHITDKDTSIIFGSRQYNFDCEYFIEPLSIDSDILDTDALTWYIESEGEIQSRFDMRILNISENYGYSLVYTENVDSILEAGLLQSEYRSVYAMNHTLQAFQVQPFRYFKSDSVIYKQTKKLDEMDYVYNVKKALLENRPGYNYSIIEFQITRYVEVYEAYPDTISIGLSKIGGIIAILNVSILIRLLHQK